MTIFTVARGGRFMRMAEILVASLRTIGKFEDRIIVFGDGKIDGADHYLLRSNVEILLQRIVIPRIITDDKIIHIDADCTCNGPIRPMFDMIDGDGIYGYTEEMTLKTANLAFTSLLRPDELDDRPAMNSGIIGATKSYWSRLSVLWEDLYRRDGHRAIGPDQSTLQRLIVDESAMPKFWPQKWIDYPNHPHMRQPNAILKHWLGGADPAGIKRDYHATLRRLLSGS